jgi:ATP-binding cassette subfamily B protein
MLLVAAVDVILPLFLRRAVDGFILPGTLEGLSGYIALYAFFIVLQVVNVICFTRLALGLEMYLSRDIKRACFVHLQELSFSYYNATPVGYMMARTMSDSGKIGLMVSWGLVDILWALVYVVGVFAMMFVLNAKLALTILLIVPFIVLASVFFQSRILTASRLIRRAHSRITGSYNEGIGGARTSKVLVIEDENLRAFSGLTEELRRAGVRGATLSAVFVPIVLFAGSLAAAVVLAKGGRLVLLGSLDLGTFSAFIAYALSIFEPIQQLARVFADFISVQAPSSGSPTFSPPAGRHRRTGRYRALRRRAAPQKRELGAHKGRDRIPGRDLPLPGRRRERPRALQPAHPGRDVGGHRGRDGRGQINDREPRLPLL